MSLRRRFTNALTFTAVSLLASDASACCLTDWLYGRQSAYYAGYAPVYGTGYAAGYPGTYSAGYAGYGITPLAAAPVLPRYQVSGVYQAQMPAYSYDNPSVYTGMPVIPPGSVPLAGQLRGNAPTTSFYGGANSYPMPGTFSQPQYSASPSYSAGYGSQVANPVLVAPQPRVGGLGRFFQSLFGTNYQSSYYRAPVTYYRPVTSVDPMTGTTVTTQQGCTSYLDQLQRSPYSSLSITQPISTQPLVTQPMVTQPMVPQPYGAYPGASCASGGCGHDHSPLAAPSLSGPSLSGPVSMPPSIDPTPTYPYGGVSQAGAIASPNSQYNIPIPSTDSYPGATYAPNNYAPNTRPLSGSPSPSDGRSYDDRTYMEQPRLESARPSQYDDASRYRSDIDRYLEENRSSSSGYPSLPTLQNTPSLDAPSQSDPVTKPQWRLQNPADSSVFGSTQTRSADRMASASEEMQSKPGYSSISPIAAPKDYQSPFSHPVTEPSSTSLEVGRLERTPAFSAPPLPPSDDLRNSDLRNSDPRNGDRFINRTGDRVSIPVVEASAVREREEYREPIQSAPKRQRRESGWK